MISKQKKASLQPPERRLKQVGNWPLLPDNRDRTRSNGLRLHEEWFRLDIRKKKILRKSGTGYQAPVVESASVEVFYH